MLNSVWRQRQHIALATLLLAVVVSSVALATEKFSGGSQSRKDWQKLKKQASQS